MVLPTDLTCGASLRCAPCAKAGPANLAASFRLIFVKTQLKLMQEALLTQRWLSTVRNHIQPCQSIDDAHLLLHESCAEAMFQHRPLWFVAGDFQKAFPRVCRQDLLCAVADGPGVRGRSVRLLADILKSDSVLVWYSGVSQTTITSSQRWVLGSVRVPGFSGLLSPSHSGGLAHTRGMEAQMLVGHWRS